MVDAAQTAVLDASALFSGKPLPRGAHVPSSILREVEGRGRDRRALEYLLETGLRVTDPSREAIGRAREAAGRTGDLARLSGTDLDVLALALDLAARVLTDDYSIQNVASVLGVPFEPVAQKGIAEVFTWTHRCVGCRRTFETAIPDCPVCGSAVKTVRRR